jgi:MFS family permease
MLRETYGTMASRETAAPNPDTAFAENQLHYFDLEVDSDGYVDFPEDSNAKPRNWRASRKAYDLSLIIVLDFFTTGISAAGTPAARFAREELRMSHTLSLFGFTSIYLVGQGLGGLVFAPFSEAFGRRWLYIISSLTYCGSCVLVGAAPNAAAAVAGRLLSGLLSSIPAVVVSGSIEDLYDSEARIWTFFIWNVAVNVSLILGPIYAAYVAMELGW